MTSQPIPYVLAARNTTGLGPTSTPNDLSTHALYVGAYRGAVFEVYRGKTTDALSEVLLNFEESIDREIWHVCAGAEPDLDPGEGARQIVNLIFRRPWLRLRVRIPAAGLATWSAIGSLDRGPVFGDANRAVETTRLESGDGVTGSVSNLVVATVDSTDYAFLAAGSDGIHVVEIADPSTIDGVTYRATIEASTLGSAELAGGRSDDLAIVDGYLVSIAVGDGAVDSDDNGVTVFTLSDVITGLDSSPADFESAVVPRSGTGVIAIPGNSNEVGGGVSGDSGVFAVATGTSDIVIASIDSGVPDWEVTDTVDTSPIDETIKVHVTSTHCIFSGRDGTNWGIQTIKLSDLSISDLDLVPGNFDWDDRDCTGPGVSPLNLAMQGDDLYAGGYGSIEQFDVGDLDDPEGPTSLGFAGVNTLGVAATADHLFAAGDFELRGWQKTNGLLIPETRTPFGAPNRVSSVVAYSHGTGTYALCASGNGGLRVVRMSALTST